MEENAAVATRGLRRAIAAVAVAASMLAGGAWLLSADAQAQDGSGSNRQGSQSQQENDHDCPDKDGRTKSEAAV